MKALGVILLVIGLLSFFGGLINPSNADISIVLFGYIIKIGLIIGGIYLLTKKSSNQKV